MMQEKFNEMTLKEKVWLVYEFGTYLLSMEYYDFWIHLYELNGEYIELFQNAQSNQLYHVSIASYADLDKYLPRILIGTFKRGN